MKKLLVILSAFSIFFSVCDLAHADHYNKRKHHRSAKRHARQAHRRTVVGDTLHTTENVGRDTVKGTGRILGDIL